ncbi:hypothetical protein MSMTP_3181 [Methanosarcina sp. MTP4]|uniref:hypothetical protein n=1 Tax=Methanosarcina sp. MTP4 TaxID=1434100 RepID=UPI0006159103|nr:hypothetical protein [Methanosarcina sp. MTP4]AKB26650.1 hypothetical protein MSMTP_3181 [Methanosarcina sp. MTP4]
MALLEFEPSDLLPSFCRSLFCFLQILFSNLFQAGRVSGVALSPYKEKNPENKYQIEYVINVMKLSLEYSVSQGKGKRAVRSDR